MNLNAEQLLALQGIYDSRGLQVIYDIMEDICNSAENEFIGVHPNNPQLVLSQHAILHAQRMFFNSVVGRVDTIVADSRKAAPKDNRRLRLEHTQRVLSVMD